MSGRIVDWLDADLRATRSWVERNTQCHLQQADGWYVKDCIERHQTPKCERCKILARLDRQLGKLDSPA